MRTIAFLLLTLGFASCTAPPIVGGDYRLSERDIREIKMVVLSRRDIRKPILSITASRADEAFIETGRREDRGDVFNQFTVAKRQGRWQIASKIEEGTIILTGSPLNR